MRKKSSTFVIVFSIILSGCGMNPAVNNDGEELLDNSNDLQEKQIQYSTVADIQRRGESIYFLEDSDCEIEYQETRAFEEGLSQAELIFVGTVQEIDNSCDQGYILSECLVRVDEPLKGPALPGDLIRIQKDQGIVTAQEYSESFTGMFGNRTVKADSDDSSESGWVVDLRENDVLSEVGQTSIYIVEKPGSDQDFYIRMFKTEYLRIGEDCYVPAEEFAQKEQDYAVSTVSADELAQTEWDNAVDRNWFLQKIAECE